MRRCVFALILASGLSGGAGAQECRQPGIDLTQGAYLPPPASGVISETFGPRQHPLLQIVKLHAGLDFDAVIGEPVTAVEAGVITFAARWQDAGNVVRIGHGGGIETTYAHLHRFEVRAGDCVERGSLIGRVGTTGITTHPHLHFEVRHFEVRHVDVGYVDVRHGSEPLDPALVLKPVLPSLQP